ncbi:peptidyl-prolyl cis-trans isomerase SurA [Flavobacterium arsenatis]|uniref:Peptidyl-prolyl cis-trans isomerase SurA n=1 Tax=Flavobacterium arsenatis TaxID=1484332 RepID=A0ABU1TJM0_9FLAO|nr:peptidyl-prolyl cis-trans isomerase SurA [Flavobacterium arsenatis]
MKFINSRNFLVLLLAVFSIGELQAQEIISDTVKKQAPKSSYKRQKIDGVIATVGDYIVLDSDIDKNFLELAANGNNLENVTRCQMLGKLLEERLYAHQALQDSIIVKDSEINSMMEEKIGVMLEQTRGSMDDLVKYYKKNSEEEFRTYFFEILKMNKLTSEMTNKIIDKVEITPEEVRTFFKGIKKEELPTFGDELEISQIVIKPQVTEAEKQKVRDRLNEFKKEIAAGSSFYSKAVLYSQDPGSKSNGGFMKVNRKTPLVKEFKDVAFSLDEGQISEPFETEYGFHIVYIEKIRGQDVDLRHILIAPKISEESLKQAKDKATLIRKKIVDGEISFADAARSESDEIETKANGGALLNPKSLDSRFELTKLDAMLYGQVSNLKTGEVSLPFIDEPRSGGKVYKLMMVTNRIAAHPADYSTDYIKIKEFALKDKQIKEIAKWTEAKIKDTYIKINGEYRDCDFLNNWLKK